MTRLEFNGKVFDTNDEYDIISEEQFKEIHDEWYTLPDKSDVITEMHRLKDGGTVIAKITKYYFRELMDNTVKYSSRWSINDVMNNIELLSFAVNRVKKNEVVYRNSLVENIDRLFNIGGAGFAAKAAQFPVKTSDDILSKYNVNGKWYDYSCGWGGRLSAALKNGVSYYGTDPNYLLIDKLHEFNDDWEKEFCCKNDVHLYCQGSEKFIPELEGTIGLAFSSPPYFLMEDYRVGDQSYKDGTSYQMWLDDYMLPTFQNIYRYLIDNGFFICNIKDFDDYPLESDMVKCAEKAGFELYQKEVLDGAIRATGKNKDGENSFTDQSENIYVFNKVGHSPKKRFTKAKLGF